MEKPIGLSMNIENESTLIWNINVRGCLLCSIKTLLLNTTPCEDKFVWSTRTLYFIVWIFDMPMTSPLLMRCALSHHGRKFNIIYSAILWNKWNTQLLNLGGFFLIDEAQNNMHTLYINYLASFLECWLRFLSHLKSTCQKLNF